MVKPSESSRTLEILGNDLFFLIERFRSHNHVATMSSYQLMVRVLREQCLVEEDPDAHTKKVTIKPNKEVSSDSLQNPSEGVGRFHESGGHADVVCAPAQATAPIPDGASFEEAAAVPVNYASAWRLLFRAASVRPGERVLVHMAGGGMGMALLQLLRAIPGVLVFSTASASKHDVLRAEGCTHPIDYRARDYAADVRAALGGGGLDVVVDPLGGADFRKGYRLLREGGRLIAFGFANAARGERRSWLHAAWQAARIPRFNPLHLLRDNRTVVGFHLGLLWDRLELLGEAMDAVGALWRQGKIGPRVDSAYPLP